MLSKDFTRNIIKQNFEVHEEIKDRLDHILLMYDMLTNDNYNENYKFNDKKVLIYSKKSSSS